MFFTKAICFFLLLLFSVNSLVAQIVTTEYHNHEQSFNRNLYPTFEESNTKLFNMDSAAFYNNIGDIRKLAAEDKRFTRALSLCEQAVNFYQKHLPAGQPVVRQLMEQSLQEAYKRGDERLISYVSWAYGALMYSYQQIDLCVTYCLQALEINKDFLARKYAFAYSGFVGEMLYHSKDFDNCIYYEKSAVASWGDTSLSGRYYLIRHLNTIGQAYQQLGQLDSALAFYKKSLRIANELNTVVWQGLNAGYMGQVYFLEKKYEVAKALLKYDYEVNRHYEKFVAAYSLQWMAKLNLVLQEKDSALVHIKESLQLLSQPQGYGLQKTNYQQWTYYTASEVYRALDKMDSFYYYFQLYASLHDSLNRTAALSSMKVAQIRIENERNYRTIALLRQKEAADRLKRNFAMAFIIMVCLVVILLVNRQLIKQKTGKLLALQEKAVAEKEVKLAREHLHMFTQNIVAKTELIDKLEERLHSNEVNKDRNRLIDELSHQTILTDEDWERFKSIFEKIHPGFFIKAKGKAPGITPAEQRMASLIRLHFTTRQTAAILGISIESVHKTRQRLRQRLRLSTEGNLDQVVASI
jgi:DNA-binding CsgD family transcriptional regulator/tetratricopeptide (TPR) repeat protein